MNRPIKFRAWLEMPDEKSMIYDLNSPSLFHGEGDMGSDAFNGVGFVPVKIKSRFVTECYERTISGNMRNMTIIGNIFENPELLEDK